MTEDTTKTADEPDTERVDDDRPEPGIEDDDEAAPSDDTSADDTDECEDQGEARDAQRRPRRRIAGATFSAMCLLLLAVYAVNGYLNVRVAQEVREHCRAEDARLMHAIEEADEDRLPALDWMIALYRARRRYARELCDETVLQLAWWRWNLGLRFEADISTHTQQEVSRTLSRAALSCENEIQTMDDLLGRELDARGSITEVRARADEMIEGQLASCRELRQAVAVSRPGFWPPLVARGQLAIPHRLRAMMPRTLDPVASTEEQDP